MAQVQAEIVLPTQELRDDIPFFQNVLGMRMDTIFPADDPSVAVFSGHGLRVRVDKDAASRLLCFVRASAGADPCNVVQVRMHCRWECIASRR